ncbi:RhuM family protein [Runella sp.]|uniref:RhuM family protein n=1 Tax=Runella sp. TaxID=1960881 RepID=UPI0030174DB0
MKNEIILYQTGELPEHIEVRIEDETVWLTQAQMATLFGQTKQNISLHINNCFKEGELEKMATVKESLTVQIEGQRKVKRIIEYFNLDIIISIGYRVKSKQGTQFRIWATHVLRDYLLKGYALNQRMNRIENNFEHLSKEVNKISLQLKTQELPNQGIFFDGQIFDAYELASRIVRSAKNEIILIDNYIDESTITHLAKKAEKVKVLLLTKTPSTGSGQASKQLALDVKKANEQYGHFEVKPLTASHDRFLIIDRNEIYHIGSSLKDLGKKWFAFSKMEKTMTALILDQIKKEGVL